MHRRQPDQSKKEIRAKVFTPIALVACLLVNDLGCKARTLPGSPATGSTPHTNIVASVGDRTLAYEDLTASLQRRNFTANKFVKGWCADAMLSVSARAGALESGRLRQVERSVLARSMLEVLYREAVAQGEPTPDELSELTRERWYEVERPAAAQTTHFVVRTRTGQTDMAAETLARKIAVSVQNIAHAEDFIAAAKAFPRGQFEVVAESLPPIVADGRSLRLDATGKPVGSGPTFDATFARAALAIEREDTQSGVIHTRFGYHVILLNHKIEPAFLSAEERRERFGSEVLSRRSRKAADRSIEFARKALPVRTEHAFQEIIAQLQVTR